MVKKNGCGCGFLGMNYWLPNLCFKRACNDHDYDIICMKFADSCLYFLIRMLECIKYGYDIEIWWWTFKNRPIYKIPLIFIAIIYFLGVLIGGWPFHLIDIIERKLK